MNWEDRIDLAADRIRGADAIAIGAGAGMGVDSGLPDFRGTAGFWRAYPACAKLGMDFAAMANPRRFVEDPARAWGFYGHRLALYRRTVPHVGFAILNRWAADAPRGGFVITPNVDGQFQRAGFDPGRIVEVHGAIDRLQCLEDCGVDTFDAPEAEVEVDPATMRASPPLPSCPDCGGLARPNILMFGDMGWDGSRTDAQLERRDAWLAGLAGARVVVVECGAGTAIPTIRRSCEALALACSGHLIRINPREPEVPAGQLGFASGALETLHAIDQRLRP